MPPSISIIMPCYNALTRLPDSVGSALSQSLTDFELIAVDDGSLDDTLAWLKRQSDPRVRIHHQSNQGVSAARNAGLTLARGRYIAFLDADDTWSPVFLEKMFTALREHPNAALAYCGWKNLGLPGPQGQPFIPPVYETPTKREDLFAGCRWPIHAALTKRDAILTAGCFNSRLQHAEDFALWLEIGGTSTIVRVPEVLAYYHFHGENQASRNRALAALQLLKAQKYYLVRHPNFAARLDRHRRRNLLYGNLLKLGYESYWQRDLTAARTIFRRVMRAGYGGTRDWRYMLPTLLPLPLHKFLINARDKLKGP